MELTIEDDSEQAMILGDRAQLEQVLVSLALHGRDAMPGGGVITIRTAIAPPSRSGPSTGGTVRISIADTGEGMPPEVRERIFEPFFTTGANGDVAGLAGLGLCVTAGVIAQSGGTISVDSRVGHGTTFVIELPEFESQAVDRPPVATGRRPGAGVLLVEDDAQVRRLFGRLVEKAGYCPMSAASGIDALAMLEHDADHIDLIITDMILPDLDGREVARQARERRPGLPVVFISDDPGEVALRTGLQSGYRFLANPFTEAELTSALSAALLA